MTTRRVCVILEHMERTGFVTICGQPNVGKSTLLNAMVGEKVAIVSPKPETTRDNIKGILTEDGIQIVFTDTPGIHRPHNMLGKYMVKHAQSAVSEADLIIFITEKKHALARADQNIIDTLPPPGSGKPVILIINKVDRVKRKADLLPLLQKALELYPFAEIIPMSAIKEKDVKKLMPVIKKYIHEGKFMYPEGQLSDRPNNFFIQEIIREKVLECTREEIPHSVAVMVDQTKYDKKLDVLEIYATIFVERLSQKGILIGKNGEMMKTIGQKARLEIKELLEKKIYLNLWVKVREKWKDNMSALEEAGYSDRDLET
jgi:GTP-binding protein Era